MECERPYCEREYRDYDRQNPPRKLAFYRRLAERAAGSKEKPRILDIGCAFGHFLASLDRRWLRFGVDASQYAIEQARMRLPDARFAVTQSSCVPFDGQFEIITAFDVLEHLQDLDATLGMMADKLAPGGGLILVVPVYDGPTGPMIRVLDRDPTHIHKEAREFWIEWPERHFDLRDWWGIYRYLLPGGYYVHAVTRSLRRFTPAIACLFQRR